MTIAAALEPARRAGRIQPVEALKSRLDLPSARRARLRWLAAVFIVVSVVGLAVAPRGAGVVASVVIYAILLAGTLLTPLLLPAMARGAGIPFALVLKVEERLARASVVRDPSRTALTLGALTIGLGMIVALGGVGQHARAAAGAWIADVVPGDVLLTSIRPVAPDEGIDTDLAAAVPGILRISPIATFDIALDGIRTDAAAVDGADLAADGRLRFIAAIARKRSRPSTPAARPSSRKALPTGSGSVSARSWPSRPPTARPSIFGSPGSWSGRSRVPRPRRCWSGGATPPPSG